MSLSNEELLERITALEHKVSNSLLMMRRTETSEYEKLVDVVCDHEKQIRNINQEIEQGPVSEAWTQSGAHNEEPAPAPCLPLNEGGKPIPT
tara:strand:- start:2595 stop:2870 length:276 start_codon:yes stop_codon:yes gene_type:complete